ncbi:hypothetical protein Q5530_20265 [Saccharothrix sp. BKS2]|uniref:hypothetical protein n=1 Tax=Saccharothrix sp. BKS2 TaxID=3064400 RepID=UPI0039ECCC09
MDFRSWFRHPPEPPASSARTAPARTAPGGGALALGRAAGQPCGFVLRPGQVPEWERLTAELGLHG